VDLESAINALCDRPQSTPLPPAELPSDLPPAAHPVERLYAVAEQRRPELAAALPAD
jgi:hypothetical protein